MFVWNPAEIRLGSRALVEGLLVLVALSGLRFHRSTNPKLRRPARNRPLSLARGEGTSGGREGAGAAGYFHRHALSVVRGPRPRGRRTSVWKTIWLLAPPPGPCPFDNSRTRCLPWPPLTTGDRVPIQIGPCGKHGADDSSGWLPFRSHGGRRCCGRVPCIRSCPRLTKRSWRGTFRFFLPKNASKDAAGQR